MGGGLTRKGNRPSENALQKAGLSYERDAVFHGAARSVFRRALA
jgi:hypothetical protein